MEYELPSAVDLEAKIYQKELASIWDPAVYEPNIYAIWEKNQYFLPIETEDKAPFSIILPPPNVTGSLHVGHALEHTLIDIVVRSKRMQQYSVLWLPGTDHAGIATQTLVEKKLAAKNITKHQLGPAAFLAKVWEMKTESAKNITGQMRRLGDSVDWSRERFTLDERSSRAVNIMFKRLYDLNIIYRAERLVNWSPVLQTAVSDIEVNYKIVKGELVSFRYGSLVDTEPHIVVATTRVETMLGDVAIAVNPKDERYRHLIGEKFDHPFLDRKIPVIADEYVDMEFGTGAVKITPAHDHNDFEIGKRHGLEFINILDKQAIITNTGTKFDGLDRFAARKAIKADLALQGRIVKEIADYEHSVGHSERSGEPIEPRISLQWWVDTSNLAQQVKAAVQNELVSFYPSSAKTKFFNWIDNIHDWCISRQLWWGHKIPVWYGPAGQEVCLGPDETPPVGWEQDKDVLDTWFSSGLWPFSTLGWPEPTSDIAKFYPNSLLVTGYDILFFWVARMMMFGSFVAKDFIPIIPLPFRKIYLHGLVRDEQGRKMSKSKGIVIDPMEIINTYGADTLRFALAKGAHGDSDVSFSNDAIAASRNYITKLYNVSKFVYTNKIDIKSQLNLSPKEFINTLTKQKLSAADIWILVKLNDAIAVASNALEEFDFNKYCYTLYHFLWDDFCDWYVEFSKIQIKIGEIEVVKITKLILNYTLVQTVKLLHPVIPFVTEYIWKYLTETDTLVLANWPVSDQFNPPQDRIEKITDLQKFITEIRRFRNDQNVKPGLIIKVFCSELTEYFTENELEIISNLTKLSLVNIIPISPKEFEINLSKNNIKVFFDLNIAVNLTAEKARLTKELNLIERELLTTEKRLANDAFITRAPKEIVDQMQTRYQNAMVEKTRLLKLLETLDSNDKI